MFGGDAFGVELDSVDGCARVKSAHDYAVFTPGVGDQRRSVRHGQRVISRGIEGRGQTSEDAVARMADRPGLAMHWRRSVDGHSAGDGNRLMTQADAEQGPLSFDASRRERDRNAGVLRRSRTGRNEQGQRGIGKRLADSNSVVAFDLNRRAQRLEIVDERERETVVVVDDQDGWLIQFGLG